MLQDMEHAFECGYGSYIIQQELLLADDSRFSTLLDPDRLYKHVYIYFKTYASKLGAILPNRPSDETTAGPEIYKFLRNQIDYFEQHLRLHETEEIRMIYAIGKKTRLFEETISANNPQRQVDIEKRQFTEERITKLIRDLERGARELEIDISEELREAKETLYLDDDEMDELKRQLKKKLCKGKPAETKRSEIDKTRIITNEYWAISLVRLPDTSNDEHAFLVLEGKIGNKSMIWFADFVTNDPNDLVRRGTREGKVRLDYHESEDSSQKLLFQCRKKIMEIRRGNRLLYSTWQIPKATAGILIANIKTQLSDPPKYNILGNTSLARSTEVVKGMPTGHNCFTFARMMLHDLNDECIEVREDKLGEWIFSATSRFLVDKQFNNQGRNMLRFGLFTLLAGVVIAFLFLKLLNV